MISVTEEEVSNIERSLRRFGSTSITSVEILCLIGEVRRLKEELRLAGISTRHICNALAEENESLKKTIGVLNAVINLSKAGAAVAGG